MSLFKTRDWWSTTCGDDDVFDFGCLKLANINENPENKDLIIVGSYNGYLRIYNPSVVKDPNGKINNTFKAHDLVIEKAFPAPILQVETGRFVSTSTKMHLAVLFSRKLIVAEVMGVSGNVNHGNQYTLRIIYEHNLQRTAFNMCKGSFGGTTPYTEPHEYICVQSMDGTISIFEYESFSLTCFLPNSLLPSPLKYIKKTDSFILVSSSWQVEVYSYRVLATNRDSNDRNNANKNDPNKSKRIQPDWIFNIGEAALDIEIINQGNNCSILILGERNLYCFTETLALKFIKKFDYNPSCFCAYPVKDTTINFLLATHGKHLFVHEEVRVKWAAQFDNVPVQMAVGKMHDLKGIIVTLSENGRLCCNYLGTEPAFSNPIVTPDERVFDFKNAENEYKQLQSKIKDAIVNTGTLIPNSGGSSSSGGVTTKSSGCLIIGIQVPNSLDKTSRSSDVDFYDTDPIPSITVKIKMKSTEPVSNVKLNIITQLPLTASPENVSYASVSTTAIEFEIIFFVKSKHIPSSLNVTIIANYNCANGTTRVQETRLQLPMRLISRPINQAMVKKQLTSQKIIFDTNKPCINLIDIFPEFAESYSPANGNAIALQYYGSNTVVSIQAAKSSNRYRLQSDSYESLWLVSYEFVKRISVNFSTVKDFALTYTDKLPIDEYKDLIEKHLEVRLLSEKYKEMMEQCSVQYRAIQKRLLSKFKDKTPTTLDNLDAILEATYRQITTVAERYEANEQELYLKAQSLCCFTNLYVLLMSISQALTREEIEVLESVLIPKVIDTPDLGWEETVNASITNLLRTTLSKTTKDQMVAQNQLKIPADASKLEKHIRNMYEKIEKGATLVSGLERSQGVVTAKNTTNTEMRPQSGFSEMSSDNTISAPMPTQAQSKTPRLESLEKPVKPKAKNVASELPSYEELVSSRSAKSSRKLQDDLEKSLRGLDDD